MSIIEILKKVLNYLFPEFSNKITWAVVVTGLALVSTSLIQELLRIIIDETFNLRISDGNDAFVGLALVAFGLIYNLGALYIKSMSRNDSVSDDRHGRTFEYDSNLFKKLESMIGHEKIEGYIDSILTGHSYYSNDYPELGEFHMDGDSTENKFISEPLEGAKSALYKDFSEFELFKSTNFFVYSNSTSERGSYLCMWPEWNCDRANPSPEEMAMYDEKSNELSVLGERVLDAYKTYRSLAKEVYAI